jgi:metal-responsive CopG/Arc/MetJ family transcriptional regulator
MAKVKVDKALLQRATELSKELGYSAVDELVEHLLEKALREHDRGKGDKGDKGKVEERLRGLGYID